jgi:TonB family protein
MTINRLLRTIVAVAFLSSASFSQTPTTVELLKAINDRDNLWSGDRSFHLEADFVTQLGGPETGHVSWKWENNDEWKQELTLKAYHQITVQKGDQLFTARNLSFTPLPVGEIRQVLTPLLVQADKWEVKKAKQHGSMDCIELRGTSKGDWKREVCLSADTRQVISDEIKNDFESHRYEFSDYQPFRNHLYPRTLKMIRDGNPVLTIVVTLLEDQSYAAGEFVPPQNAIVRRKCQGMILPKALKTPDPVYPSSELEKHVSGTSIVSLTVMPDGSVDDVHLIGSSSGDMDKVTQQIVRTWKFEPAMCGSEAVAADIQVQVNFRLR